MSASAAHLVRHGEVENPHHVVYADLPGYGLSALGTVQAEETGAHLTNQPIRLVVSSPLLRAQQTAAAIAAPHGLTVVIDEGLTEWAGGTRWAGVRWENLDVVFPGELTAYLETPLELSFAAESIQDCGARVAATTRRWVEEVDDGEIVIVSHQDPIHSGRLTLAGRISAQGGAEYHDQKPTHASVISLEPATPVWREAGYWEPRQGEGFPPIK